MVVVVGEGWLGAPLGQLLWGGRAVRLAGVLDVLGRDRLTLLGQLVQVGGLLLRFRRGDSLKADWSSDLFFLTVFGQPGEPSKKYFFVRTLTAIGGSRGISLASFRVIDVGVALTL